MGTFQYDDNTVRSRSPTEPLSLFELERLEASYTIGDDKGDDKSKAE
jgi:hypothetical protein